LLRFSLRQLTYFASAAETASISSASRALHVSQPAISAAIAHLEREVGTQLFIRHHGRGLSLTPEGRRFLADTRDVLGRASHLLTSRQEDGGPLSGAIDLGFFITFGPFFMPGLLKAFQREHPGVEVRFHEGDADRLYSGLIGGSLDLALAYDLGTGPGVTRELLLERPPYLLLPKRHPMARKASIRLADLRREPFVLHDLPHSRAYMASVFQQVDMEPLVRHRTSSFELVRGLVASGEGVSILVMRPVGDRSYDGNAIVCRPIADPVPGLRIMMLSRSQTPPSRVQEAMMREMRSYFAGLRQSDV
jgi:DNA-binding transcriptional LysR family regulator